MIKIYRVSNVQKFAASISTERPRNNKAVRLILDDVKRRGDKAVLDTMKKDSTRQPRVRCAS